MSILGDISKIVGHATAAQRRRRMTVKSFVIAVVGSMVMLGCRAKPDAAGICKKIEASGIGKNCTQIKAEVINARAKTKYDFDLVRVAGEKGAVLDFATDDDYSTTVNAYATMAMFAGPHRYGNPSTRIFVQMNTGASIDDGNAVKAIVGGVSVPAASPATASVPTTAAAASAPPQPAAGDPTSASNVVIVEAAMMLTDYKANELRADAKYKGKRVRVTGVVGDIKKDVDNHIFVTVGTGAHFEVPEAQCFFGDDHATKAAALTHGDTVTVECSCQGLMMNVVMKNCSFAGPLAEVSASGGAALPLCATLKAAGVASVCQQHSGGDDAATFETAPPGTGGLIMVLADDVKFQKAIDKKTFAGNGMTCFPIQKSKAFMCLLKGATPDQIKKTRAVVDGL